MKYARLFSVGSISSLAAAAVLTTLLAAEPAKDAKPAAGEAPKLPPGWTMADLQACIVAGTPGKNHEFLAKGVGEWKAKSTIWMAPGADAITSEGASTMSPMMGGRFYKVEMTGEMPGMGPYNGFGIHGYDNVAGKFVSTWIDNHGTGMMTGTGELSKDGKTLTWDYQFSCPLTKKASKMREVETITGPNTKTLEAWGADPKSGKEYQMMSIELTKK
jgi:hypothetical protein